MPGELIWHLAVALFSVRMCVSPTKLGSPEGKGLCMGHGDWCAGDFQDNKTNVYDSLMVHTRHYINTFGKTYQIRSDQISC